MYLCCVHLIETPGVSRRVSCNFTAPWPDCQVAGTVVRPLVRGTLPPALPLCVDAPACHPDVTGMVRTPVRCCPACTARRRTRG